jgi:hypothetical protein
MFLNFLISEEGWGPAFMLKIIGKAVAGYDAAGYSESGSY